MKLVLAALALTPLALTLPAFAGAATTAPRVAATSFEQLAKPLPLPYDESADADAKVVEARARARREHKRLLVDYGGNWCLDCRVLAGTIELPDLKPWVDRHFVVVTVNSGRFDKNTQITARYGIKGRSAGVPAVMIVDPRSGRVLNAGHETALADARSMSPQGLADWLAQYAG